MRTALPGGDPVCALNGWESCSGSTTSCPRMVHLTESALREVGKSLKGSTIALLSRAFINDSDDAPNTLEEPFRDAARAAGAEVRMHDPWVEPGLRPPDAPPGLSWDLEEVLSGSDAVVGGGNMVDPDAWIAAGFGYWGIGRAVGIGDRSF